jgi:two-component system, LuxR family, response regulator DctR
MAEIQSEVKGIVHIVDDEEAIRDSLAWLMASRQIACQKWATGSEFLSTLPLDCPACIILDVRMPGLNGPDVFDKLLEQDCDAPVIFLTGHAEVAVAVEVLKNGAFDFVEKPFNDNRLVELAQSALKRHRELREIANDKTAVEARLATLTTREREVLSLILAGQLNKQIAGNLELAIRTVEFHRATILNKMGVRNAIELAGLVARSGTQI